MSDAPHWSEPGAYPVADGIHRIPLPLPLDGLRAVNVYVVETGRGLTLVDGGWAVEAGRAALDAGLAAIGAKVSHITRFLVTHVHRDHYTQAVTLRRELGAHVGLGAGEQANLDAVVGQRSGTEAAVDLLRRSGAHELARRWQELSAGHDLDLSVWEPPDAWLQDGEQVEVGDRRLEVVATPGHTRGHVVFVERAAGLLFAGDHVLPTITPSIGFEPAPVPLPLGDFLASLARVRALPDLRLLPAHGAVTSSTHERIDELVAHHDDRLRLCRDAVAGGLGTSHEVAGVLPWTRRSTPFAELDVFNAALAVLETMAHLELLAARGELAREQAHGVRVYGVPAVPRVGG